MVLALGMYLVVNRTRLGMMIRAGASNRDMVRGLGIDITRLYRVVFAGGVALAALAGMMAAPVSSVYPGMGGHGADHLLRGGGDRRHRLDQRRAAGALLIGVVDTFGKVFFAELRACSVYVLMALILLWRPKA
jgi:branched-chain amino acid transport system permease protein